MLPMVVALIVSMAAVHAAEPSEKGLMNVLDFGAKGDGSTDDTAAFQSALDKAGITGGTVYAPPGLYRINGVLNIPEGVTLEGTWPGPHTSQLDKGTTLLAFAGRGDEDSDPFISLRTGSTLKGVTICYPDQKATDVHPYPWTIQGRGQHFNIIDVTITNAYNGIDCGTFHNEGHHLRNVHMCALRRGVFIDQCTDIGRLENVHIHNVYYWRMSTPCVPSKEEVDAVQRYTPEHLEGFIIGRTDWEYISNCFVIWAKVGFHFIRGKGLANAVITQSGSDIGPLAVKIDAVQDHAGVAFENCQFMSGFEVGPDNVGPVKLSNCGFWGRSGTGPQMTLLGRGTVTLTSVHFSEWAEDKPCISVAGGSLLMSSCEFMGSPANTQHVYLGKDVVSAVISGNRFRHGNIGVVNESDGDVQILANVKA